MDYDISTWPLKRNTEDVHTEPKNLWCCSFISTHRCGSSFLCNSNRDLVYWVNDPCNWL